ncbi:hypothetical protein HYALB_00004214 [Hymenoscyphus albidus]|uniref:Uncharacterized protein n=1 Tax=Hymenoscyphus albidus TaxID=595503 RepID=A0A9N9M6W8_9HELO|nr:hypothetical protein HYALB_00004214 [Hymenoscyphus albidus]
MISQQHSQYSGYTNQQQAPPIGAYGFVPQPDAHQQSQNMYHTWDIPNFPSMNSGGIYRKVFCPIEDAVRTGMRQLVEQQLQQHYASARYSNSTESQMYSGYPPTSIYNNGYGYNYGSSQYQYPGYQNMYANRNEVSSYYHYNNYGSAQQPHHRMDQMTYDFSNLAFRRTPGARRPARDISVNSLLNPPPEEEMKSPSPIRILSPTAQLLQLQVEQEEEQRRQQQEQQQQQTRDKGKGKEPIPIHQETQSTSYVQQQQYSHYPGQYSQHPPSLEQQPPPHNFTPTFLQYSKQQYTQYPPYPPPREDPSQLCALLDHQWAQRHSRVKSPEEVHEDTGDHQWAQHHSRVKLPEEVHEDTTGDHIAETKSMSLLTQGFLDGPPIADLGARARMECWGQEGPPSEAPKTDNFHGELLDVQIEERKYGQVRFDGL